jgi:uncharacterized protein
MDGKPLEILVCPCCHQPLHWAAGRAMLVCKAERLGFPIEKGIPLLLEEQAIAMPEIEVARSDAL